MTKKILAILLVLSFVLVAFAGCGETTVQTANWELIGEGNDLMGTALECYYSKDNTNISGAGLAVIYPNVFFVSIDDSAFVGRNWYVQVSNGTTTNEKFDTITLPGAPGAVYVENIKLINLIMNSNSNQVITVKFINQNNVREYYEFNFNKGNFNTEYSKLSPK